MVRITEDLIRRRAEHNEGEIGSLEEISLHQQDIEKIEHIDNWCKNLKILYFQNNLIAKIEHVGRLKKLEYINLALNNIERIENLEGCESLVKLDLTVNFIGELTSVTSLINLNFLRELYLTGNPCVQYDCYRKYVIATLPQLEMLDGISIERRERIEALQDYLSISKTILDQEIEYLKKRMIEKDQNLEKMRIRAERIQKESENFDEIDKEFWDEAVPFSPESRIESHNMIQKKNNAKEETKKEPKPRPLFAPDGRPYNINEPKIEFSLKEQKNENLGECIILTVKVYKHLDTTFIDCDINPTYVRVKIKEKILQLTLNDEILPDSSVAQRSQITGELVITMPKLNQDVLLSKPNIENKKQIKVGNNPDCRLKREKFLEIDENHKSLKDKLKLVDFGKQSNNLSIAKVQERLNDVCFIDDPGVPPLI